MDCPVRLILAIILYFVIECTSSWLLFLYSFSSLSVVLTEEVIRVVALITALLLRLTPVDLLFILVWVSVVINLLLRVGYLARIMSTCLVGGSVALAM